MRIIQASLEHLDLITPLFVKYREFYGELPFPDSSRAFLEKRLRRKESVIYLAMPDNDDTKVLGFCQLYPSFSSLSLKRVWILNDIYVAEDARRMLVADHLMRTAKKWPRTRRRCACVCPPAAVMKLHKKCTNPSAFAKTPSSKTTCCPSPPIEPAALLRHTPVPRGRVRPPTPRF